MKPDNLRMTDDRYSRNALAGYDMALMTEKKALVVGCGAAGGNVLQFLAMSGLGEMLLVDHDQFHISNASRSIHYGTDEERTRHNGFKAPCCAASITKLTSWADRPRVGYYTGRIQALGDWAFAYADVVVCAVDHLPSVMDIAALGQRNGTPVVRVSFDGFSGSCAAYSSKPNGPCCHCGVLRVESDLDFGCDTKEELYRRQGVIGATQTLAAITGGVGAEAAIQVLHGNEDTLDRRVSFPDIRRGETFVTRLKRRPSCPNPHAKLPQNVPELETPTQAPVRELLAELEDRGYPGCVRLRSPYVRSTLCVLCQDIVAVEKPIWAIDGPVVCAGCGGEWEKASGDVGEVVLNILHSETGGAERSCEAFGLASGETLTAEWPGGGAGFVRLPLQDNPFVFIERF